MGKRPSTDKEAMRQEFIAIRKELELRQEDVAASLERSLGWVRRIEQGQIDCPRYAILALRRLKSKKKEIIRGEP